MSEARRLEIRFIIELGVVLDEKFFCVKIVVGRIFNGENTLQKIGWHQNVEIIIVPSRWCKLSVESKDQVVIRYITCLIGQ